MSAVAEIPIPLATTAPWSRKLASLDTRQRMRFAIGVVLLVGVAIAAIVIARQPDWRVLYANLADKDGGAVIAQLAQMNVPYKYSEGGGAVMVPADRVHDLRLRLASQGLPKGSVAGFELMENNRFGMTQFQEKLSFQRGLEGELTRSIQALGSVQAARVHLALPNQNGFFREQQKPTASVLLTLHPGRTLERNQIAGIVHLVASSVPELNPAAVSVVDDTGKLLSNNSNEPGSGADAQQLQYTQQIEQQYARRILDMLEPMVGRQNVKAQVTADVDFSQTEATSEEHKPNLSADASAVRSQQTAGTTATAGAAAARPPGKRESTTNYEVDKTTRTVRSATGQIKRLSAAVVINYQSVVDAQGKPGAATALSAQQIEQMTALVRESIGFSKDRGDSVNLMNAQFLSERNEVADVPIWKNPQTLDMARSFAWPIGLVLIGAIVLLGLVRPGLKTLAAAAPPPQLPGSQLDAMLSETPQRPALASIAEALPPPAAPEQARLEGARQMARQNPVAVANIVKTWVNGDEAAAASA